MAQAFPIGTVSELLISLRNRMIQNRVETMTVDIKCEGMEDFDIHLFLTNKSPEYPRLVPN